MINITKDFIRKNIADSDVIYTRGLRIYQYGSFLLDEAEDEKGIYQYKVDGNYGDYRTKIHLTDNAIETFCSCPYPGNGCKHTVAVLLDLKNYLLKRKESLAEAAFAKGEASEPFFSAEEIKQQAIDDRKKRAKHEIYTVTEGEMIKGEHLLETTIGRQYTITLHDPDAGLGYCSCPDFSTNRLGVCKHLNFLVNYFKKTKNFKNRIKNEKFPFIDIYWDSRNDLPRIFCERPDDEISDIRGLIVEYFNSDGLFRKKELSDFLLFLSALNGDKRVRVQDYVLGRIDDLLIKKQLKELGKNGLPSLKALKCTLYPYQVKGVEFALYKQSVLIGDEMGLGKTLQAIALGILKKDIFNFKKVLIVTLASLKEQWKREIERFSDEKAVVVTGNPGQRRATYIHDDAYFKITNYEAVLRDVMILSHFKPDLIILDEAQRIKNFSTKTADAVKRISRKQALVLTGTPLENKLEDVYSIIQFLDPLLLSPLWSFAADHFMLSRNKKGRILGYRNLDKLHEKLKSIVIRRRKKDVLPDLPEEIVNNYYIELHEKQKKMHSGYLQALLPLLNKKFLTPVDLRKIQVLFLRMRMVCNSTYLIDRKTHISPKLKELEAILEELVIQSERKIVIFSEWTTMTFLVARLLSEAGIPFVELSGKVPVHKRQALIDEFTNNPECMAFLSTDAGGTGLNLQAADCVVNCELPWNPAKMNQRIGRVNRIGQESKCVNVINLISKDSIEEKIFAGIQLKTDLFQGVFDGGIDTVEFSSEKRTEMLNRLREMMGEEPVLPTPELNPSEEVPEDTPNYLNPKVLNKDQGVDFTAEEDLGLIPEEEISISDKNAALEKETAEPERVSSVQSSEKMEDVLNSGMEFIGGLLEMATGNKIKPVENGSKIVSLDSTTGEVTLKFKLPGF